MVNLRDSSQSTNRNWRKTENQKSQNDCGLKHERTTKCISHLPSFVYFYFGKANALYTNVSANAIKTLPQPMRLLTTTIFLIMFYSSCKSQTTNDKAKLIQMDYFDEEGQILLKLYKKTDKGYLYWETWNTNDKNAVIHWGQIGQRGQASELKKNSNKDLRVKLKEQIDKTIGEGYSEIPLESQYTIAVTFKLDSWGTPKDLDRREEIRNILTEHLGWTGNGRCDDGDIGSGEMTLYADVIDPYVGVKTILEELKLKNVKETCEFTIMQGDKVLHQDYKVDK